jgi:hypothetical protein
MRRSAAFPPRDLVAEREALEDEAALRRPVLIANDVLVRLEVPRGHRQAGERVALLGREVDDAFELADQRVCADAGAEVRGRRHPRRSCVKAGAHVLSATGALSEWPMMHATFHTGGEATTTYDSVVI